MWDTITANIHSFEEFKEKCYPFTSVVILVLAEFLTLKLKFAKDYYLFIIVINGLVFGYMSFKLIIATMTKV
jgi:hypothetical protein